MHEQCVKLYVEHTLVTGGRIWVRTIEIECERLVRTTRIDQPTITDIDHYFSISLSASDGYGTEVTGPECSEYSKWNVPNRTSAMAGPDRLMAIAATAHNRDFFILSLSP